MGFVPPLKVDPAYGAASQFDFGLRPPLRMTRWERLHFVFCAVPPHPTIPLVGAIHESPVLCYIHSEQNRALTNTYLLIRKLV